MIFNIIQTCSINELTVDHHTTRPNLTEKCRYWWIYCSQLRDWMFPPPPKKKQKSSSNKATTTFVDHLVLEQWSISLTKAPWQMIRSEQLHCNQLSFPDQLRNLQAEYCRPRPADQGSRGGSQVDGGRQRWGISFLIGWCWDCVIKAGDAGEFTINVLVCKATWKNKLVFKFYWHLLYCSIWKK
jgi:hypothetical protein